MKWQRFLDRFVAATSYAAFLRVLLVLSGTLVQGLVPLWIAGVVLFDGRMRGPQNVCALLAGQALVSLVPMPEEMGRGLWVLPSVLLYISIIATMGWALYAVLDQKPKLGEAFATVFEQYISLFAITRSTSAFLDSSANAEAFYALAFAYMVLPDALAPCTDTLPPALASSAWMRHFTRNAEGIAIRGAQRGVLAVMNAWATVGDGRLALQLVAVYFTGYDEDRTKLGHIHILLSANLAQTLLLLLQNDRLSEWTCVLGLGAAVTLLTLLWRPRTDDARHVFGDCCAFSASLLLVSILERWLAGSAVVEWATTYLVVFCLLEKLHDDAPWTTASLGGIAMPAQFDMGFAMAVEDGLAIW